jgi:hypothetical protein
MTDCERGETFLSIQQLVCVIEIVEWQQDQRPRSGWTYSHVHPLDAWEEEA